MTQTARNIEPVHEIDLDSEPVRELNRQLHHDDDIRNCNVHNPKGRHSLAVGLTAPIEVDIRGHVGYYCAGMNKSAAVTVHGNAGAGVAENMMSGRVHVTGSASHYAGASGHGGLLVIDGDASARCGISMKGIDIVVGGSAGHMSAFMAQSGRLVICGDAGSDLGDSIYEAVIYVRGSTAGLGSDCVQKDMTPEHIAGLEQLLKTAGVDADPADFRRYGSARKLYNFDIDHADEY